MAKITLKRVRRSRRLTRQEVARDQELRRKSEAEFPPPELGSASTLLSDSLKDAIIQSEKSEDQLAKQAGVSSVVLKQFLAGQRDLRLATAEKLANILGLKLVSS